MRSINGLLILLSVGIASQALAADPPAPPAQNAAAATTSAAPSAPAAATAAAAPTAAPTAAKTDAATSNGGTEAQVKTLRSAGYKPEKHNGQTLWCRRETQLGTRFATKSCGTAEDLERQTKESQDMATRVQQKNVYNPKGS
jgi:hypothetical protein